MSIYAKLLQIQQELKAPKNQFNSFGKYNYRNCEDILEGVKPLLKEHGCVLLIKDEVVIVGDRYYVQARASLIDIVDGKEVNSVAMAREEETKKGMDGSQVTGASSSYARKYALNGLFAIDDTKDADTKEPTKPEQPKQPKQPTPTYKQPENNGDNIKNIDIITTSQAKRLFAIASGQHELLKQILESFGYSSSKDIKKVDYEKIVDATQQLVNAALKSYEPEEKLPWDEAAKAQ